MLLIQNKNCPICSGDEFSSFLGRYDIQECKNCEIVFDQTSSLDKTYYEHERVSCVDIKKLPPRKRNVLQRANLCKNILEKNFKVLDIGCGEGLFLKELQKYVAEVQGLEPTIKYVNYARNELNLNVHQGVIENTSFPPSYFDVITMFHVLEHLEHPNEALKKISSWLKPGGFLIIEVPNIKSPTATYRGLQWELIIPEHRLYFSPDSLSFLLKQNGFNPITVLSRDFDQYRNSIGKSLRKLGLVLNRSQKVRIKHKKEGGIIKSSETKQESTLKQFRKNIQLPFKASLGWLVLKFSRGDYLFVISKKGGV